MQLLSPLYTVPARQANQDDPFTFYATFDIDSLCSYIPEQTAILLPASSWARIGLKKPAIPAHITMKAADSGGFVASRVWGEYRYSLAQYVSWLETWRPQWAATMDYCCEPELAQITRNRQDRTTHNALATWETYHNTLWAWCPTIQGYTPDEYKRHASELKPLIDAMQAHYTSIGNPWFRVGIGTLCKRNDVTSIQAIVSAIRGILPGVPLHLWGIKLDALRSINLTQVTSTDSAVWHSGMYASNDIRALAQEQGMSIRAYKVKVNLPAYITKIEKAVTESRRITRAQDDPIPIAQARAILQAQGWTINLRTKRNRQYVYAVRRKGARLEQWCICPVSELEHWIASQS